MKDYSNYEKEEQRQEALNILRYLYKICKKPTVNNKDPFVSVRLPPKVFNVLKLIASGKGLDVNAFVKNLVIKTIKSEHSEKLDWSDLKESAFDSIDVEVLTDDELAFRSVVQNHLFNSITETLTQENL